MFGSSKRQMTKDNITDSASVPPTNSGVPAALMRNATDLIQNQGEAAAQPIRQPAYAQLLVSSTDRYVSQSNTRIPIGGTASTGISASATLNPTVSGKAVLTITLAPTTAFTVGEAVFVDLSGVGPSKGFNGTITDISASVITISNITNLTGTFPATGVWLVYATVPPQTSQNIRLFGNIIPFSPGPQYTTPSSVASFILQYPQYLLQGHFTRLAISQLQFQWNIPTINGRNNTFTIRYKIISEGITTYETESYTIGNEWYTPTQLAAAIQALVLAGTYGAASGFTAQYIQGTFVFATATIGYTFQFVDDGLATTANFYLTVGMNFDSLYTFSSATITGPPPMTYTRWIDLTSTELTRFQKVKDSTTARGGNHLNTLARVYCNPPSTTQTSAWGGGVMSGLPFYITYDFPTPKYIRWDGKLSLLNFDLNCFDEFGEPIYWTPSENSEFQFTLLASET
jgi:hypothetical protein